MATALLLLAACASIIEGSTDHISVITTPSVNASCTLTNERGSFSTPSGAQATVKKSRTDLDVRCVDKRSGLKGKSKVESDVEAWAFGNLIFGGLIGLTTDWITGAAYNYPDRVLVSMLNPKAYAQANQAPAAKREVTAPHAFTAAPVMDEPTPPEEAPAAPVPPVAAMAVPTPALAPQPVPTTTVTTPKGVAFDWTRMETPRKPVAKTTRRPAKKHAATSSKNGCRALRHRCPANAGARHPAGRSSRRA